MKIARCSATLALSAWLLSSSAQTSAQMPVPPPAEQISADCARPIFASDQLVCGDTELRQLDRKLAQTVSQNAALRSTEFIEDGSQWFKRRSRCAFEADHRGCLVAAYQDRITIIEGGSSTSDRGVPGKCKLLGRVSVSRLSNGYLVVRSVNDGAFIAIASTSSGSTVWKSMLSYSERGHIIDFSSQDGRKFSCKVKR